MGAPEAQLPQVRVSRSKLIRRFSPYPYLLVKEQKQEITDACENADHDRQMRLTILKGILGFSHLAQATGLGCNSWRQVVVINLVPIRPLIRIRH